MHQSITDDNHPPSVKYDYQQHIDLSIQWTRRLLKPIGLWPSSHATPKLQKYFFQFINVAFYGLIAFRSLPMAIYIFLEIEDVYSKLKQCGPLIFGLISFAKYYSMIVHGAEIRECVERIKWDWKNITFSDDRDIMLTNANFGRKMTILCTLFTYSGFVFYNVVIPFSIGKITTEDNLTYIPLVFPFSSYIMDTRHSPVNEIVFSIQLMAAFVGHTTGVAACGLAASLAAHICGQIQVLINWLNHLVDGRSDMDDNVDRRIARVVSQHVRVLKFLTLTEQTLRQMSFAEFLGCTLDICLVGYYVIMEFNDLKTAITYVSLLISLTFNIFIFCYIGEIVTENCRKIGEMSYMIEWYRLPGKKKLCCVMIIAMSNSTASLTAGKMVELTINTFANVIKTAVGFLNVLRATT